MSDRRSVWIRIAAGFGRPAASISRLHGTGTRPPGCTRPFTGFIACVEIASFLSRLIVRADILEMLLLLLCEHLQHDRQRRMFSRSALGLGTSSAGPLAGFGPISGASSSDTSELLRRHLEPALSRLQALELVSACVPARAHRLTDVPAAGSVRSGRAQPSKIRRGDLSPHPRSDC